MKTLLVVLLLVTGMALFAGCKPKTERDARRVEMRNRVIRRNMEGIPDDWEAIWLMDEPLRLNQYEGQ